MESSRPGTRFAPVPVARRERVPRAFALALFGLACFSADAQSDVRRFQSDSALSRARALVEAGEPEQAVRIYEGLAEANPGDKGILLKLAVARFQAAQYEQAIGLCRQVVERDPGLAPFWLFLGASHYNLEQFDDAVRALSRALDLQPGERNARLMLAESLLSLGSAREALPHFEEVSATLPDSPRVWYGLNRTYVLLQETESRRLRQEFPASGFAAASFADEYREAAVYEQAAVRYREALERPEELGVVASRHAAEALAAIHRESGRSDLAGEVSARHLRSPAGGCGAEGAACAFADGRLDDVLRASGSSADAGALLYWRARAYSALAEAAFRRLSTLPPSAQFHEIEARRLGTQGSHRLAARSWGEALDLDPTNRVLRTGLANALYEARDFDAALPLLNELIESEPSAELLFLRGGSNLNLHRVEQAVTDLVRAVELAPGLDRARAELSRAYLLVGQPESAIPHLQRLLRSDSDGSYHYRLATAYGQTGRSDLAADALRGYRRIVSERDGAAGKPSAAF